MLNKIFSRKISSLAILSLVASIITLSPVPTAQAITPVGDSNAAAWAAANTPQNL